MKKINIITLGCAKNTVDSEQLAGQLAPGWQVAFDDDSTEAKVVVVNTCGFILDAQQESIDTILRLAEAKKAGLIERIFVMGCLSERYKEELRAEISEVDEYFGVNNLSDILLSLGAIYDPKRATARQIATPSHYAYLKI
ncbi:MAG: 30S ribosomal protein S12 methylthiotransferase RimO, partial [Mucinivorans sp.]